MTKTQSPLGKYEMKRNSLCWMRNILKWEDTSWKHSRVCLIRNISFYNLKIL